MKALALMSPGQFHGLSNTQQHCFDPETEQVYDDHEANKLLRDRDRGYRTPFVVPEEV